MKKLQTNQVSYKTDSVLQTIREYISQIKNENTTNGAPLMDWNIIKEIQWKELQNTHIRCMLPMDSRVHFKHYEHKNSKMTKKP